jgi:hypothetical protein
MKLTDPINFKELTKSTGSKKLIESIELEELMELRCRHAPNGSDEDLVIRVRVRVREHPTSSGCVQYLGSYSSIFCNI